jgi:hypothetical protein
MRRLAWALAVSFVFACGAPPEPTLQERVRGHWQVVLSKEQQQQIATMRQLAAADPADPRGTELLRVLEMADDTTLDITADTIVVTIAGEPQRTTWSLREAAADHLSITMLHPEHGAQDVELRLVDELLEVKPAGAQRVERYRRILETEGTPP